MRKATKIISIIYILNVFHYSMQAQSYTLYGILGNYLVSIDPVTGVASEIAALNPVHFDFTALTFIPEINKLFAVVNGTTNPRLISIDRCTGATAVIGYIDQATPALDLKLIEALAYNPDDSLLYAAGFEVPPPDHYTSRRLMRVDPFTANATVYNIINASCQDEADDFAFTSGVQYILDECPVPIIISAIDIYTGITTYIGANASIDGTTLAVHPSSGMLYGINKPNRELYRVSPTSAAATFIGQTHTASDFVDQFLLAIAFAPSPDTSLIANPASLVECDLGSGDAIFDLTSIAPVVSGGNATVHWYFDIGVTSPIPFPAAVYIESTTIFATISDFDHCETSPAPISLIVNPSFTATPTNLEACDRGDGQAIFDLTTIENVVNGGNGTVNWYTDTNGTIPITNPANVLTDSTTLYATVGSAPCESNPVPVSLVVLPIMDAFPTSITGCDQGNGQATFNLTSSEAIVSGGSGNVNWYWDMAGDISILNLNIITFGDTTLYATVGSLLCESNPVPVSLIANTYPTAFPASLKACDSGNGQAIFNVSTLEDTIRGGIGTVNWYWDINGSTPITDPSNITSDSSTVYATVNDGPCEGDPVPVPLIVIPYPVTTPVVLGGCNQQNGQEEFDLTRVENAVSGSNGSISWYMDLNASIPIADPSAMISGNTTVYAIVINEGICESPPVPVTLTIGIIAEDDDNNGIDDACDYCNTPSALSTSIHLAHEVQLSWLPPANSNACLLSIQSLNQPDTIVQTLYAPNHDSWTLPDSLLNLGDTYQWHVVCHCTEDAYNVSPSSGWKDFLYGCSPPEINSLIIDNCNSPTVLSWYPVNGAEIYEFHGETINGAQQLNRTMTSPGFSVPVAAPNGLQVLVRLREQCSPGFWSAWTPLIPYNITCNQAALKPSSINLEMEQNIEKNVNSGFVLFPNPVCNSLNMEYYSENAGNAHVEIFDIIGNSTYFEYFYYEPGLQKTKIDLERLFPGTYLLQFVKGDKIVVKKFIKTDQ